MNYIGNYRTAVSIGAICRLTTQKRRTAKANQIRGLVAEYGLVPPKHLSSLRAAIPCWLEDAENGLTHYFRSLLHGLWEDLLALDDRLCEMDFAGVGEFSLAKS